MARSACAPSGELALASSANSKRNSRVGRLFPRATSRRCPFTTSTLSLYAQLLATSKARAPWPPNKGFFSVNFVKFFRV